MSYKTGTDKQQLTFMPMCPEDYVSEDHICRVICAFTEQLDMAGLGFKYAQCMDVGNRPFDPRMMLDLYLYGYLHRVRSSRRLEAETHRNIEVMWIMDGLTPDDKTISNFRKDNSKALREVFRAFNRMCRKLDLFGGELAATDGSKFRADNSRKNNHNKTTVERELSRIEKHISEYLNALDENDAAEAAGERLSVEEIKDILEMLNARKEKFAGIAQRLETESEVSTVDPDSRLMHSNGDARKLDVCYNVQTIVDEKYHMIADFDVTGQADDKGQLQNMSERAMEVMGVETLTNLADKGYYDGEDIAACEENGVTCLVAKPAPGGAKKTEGFTINDFSYDRENDCYICPCKNTLKFMRLQKHSNGKEYRVYAHFAACRKCPQRSLCTNSNHRQIMRLPYQDVLDAVDERTRSDKKLYRRRQEIVEHPFGTIKAVWGYKQFLCRTKPKVSAETAMACLAYNLRRVFNIYGGNVDKLLAEMVA
jgi:transposase